MYPVFFRVLLEEGRKIFLNFGIHSFRNQFHCVLSDSFSGIPRGCSSPFDSRGNPRRSDSSSIDRPPRKAIVGVSTVLGRGRGRGRRPVLADVRCRSQPPGVPRRGWEEGRGGVESSRSSSYYMLFLPLRPALATVLSALSGGSERLCEQRGRERCWWPAAPRGGNGRPLSPTVASRPPGRRRRRRTARCRPLPAARCRLPGVFPAWPAAGPVTAVGGRVGEGWRVEGSRGRGA